jgi:hypothetical protein
MERIYPQQWMALPKETKNHLIKVFGIPKSGITEIRDQDVVSDGYTSADLEAINLDKMCEYIGSRETFGRAWEITLMRVKSDLNPPMELPVPVIDIAPAEVKSVFCDKCVAPREPHFKKCPNYTKINAN